ncbi:MAG: universal stress protein [Deltaproteobacteria bacterium]|nr:universal stress protein [Deltaproteobacteria bacterium]
MFKKILCPVDFSDTSMNAAYNAINFASEIKAEITFIHIIDIKSLQNIGDLSGGAIDNLDFLVEEEKPTLNILKEECEKKGVKVKTILMRGEPHSIILETIKENGHDIVIMGTHGRKGLTRAVLGSMAESVVRKSDVPVLLYHYKG